MNRLNKTKTEKTINFAEEKLARQRRERDELRHLEAKKVWPSFYVLSIFLDFSRDLNPWN